MQKQSQAKLKESVKRMLTRKLLGKTAREKRQKVKMATKTNLEEV
jgi:hypothetical protein